MSLETPPPDLKFYNDDYVTDIDEDDIFSFSGNWCNFDDNEKVTSRNLPENSQTLEDELNNVKFEIVKMMSVKEAYSRESQSL